MFFKVDTWVRWKKLGMRWGILISLVLLGTPLSAQYLISGKVEKGGADYTAYLSILENWNDFDGISSEMVFKESSIDSLGNFEFAGTELSEKLGFYRVHFSPKGKTPYWLNGVGNGKNAVSFLLRDGDTVSIRLKQATYHAGELELSSTIPENADFLAMTAEADSFELLSLETENERYLNLLTEAQQASFLKQIETHDHPLLRLFLIYTAGFSYSAHPEMYQQVGTTLRNSDFLPTYHSSFSNYLGSQTHEALTGANRLLGILLGISIILNLVLLGLWWIRRKDSKIDTPEASPALAQLTAKEQQILELIGAHKTNKEIAAQLFISEATVKTHINNLYRKTGIHSRKAAISLVKAQKSTPV